jgi:hypothetical protein
MRGGSLSFMLQPVARGAGEAGDMDGTCGDQCGAPVGVRVAGGYVGALFWQCRTCNRRWHRFPEGTVMRRRAEPFVLRALASLAPRRAAHALQPEPTTPALPTPRAPQATGDGQTSSTPAPGDGQTPSTLQAPGDPAATGERKAS